MERTTGCPRETKEGGADAMQGQLDSSRVAWDARCAMPPSVAWRTAPSDLSSSCVEPTPCAAQRHEAATSCAFATSAKWRFGRHQCSWNDQSSCQRGPTASLLAAWPATWQWRPCEEQGAPPFAKEPNFFTEEPHGREGPERGWSL